MGEINYEVHLNKRAPRTPIIMKLEKERRKTEREREREREREKERERERERGSDQRDGAELRGAANEAISTSSLLS